MYCGYVTSLHDVNKHPNADRLQCAYAFSNQVIVDTSYYEGQKVAYFPVDGQLSEEFARDNNLVRVKDENGKNIGGYLDPNKRNICAIRLRGEKSDGLVLPIEVLSKYVDVRSLNDGDEITVLNGVEICKKYIPVNRSKPSRPSAQSKSGKRKIAETKYPFFAKHVDTAQLVYNSNAFHIGDTIYITLKMHGTSARTMNALEVKTKTRTRIQKLFGMKDKTQRNYSIISGSRNRTLTDYEGGFYNNDRFREKYNTFFANVLPKGVEVFYEIVGYVNEETPIMGKCNNARLNDKDFLNKYGKETVFSYGCQPGENECYVYRMTMTNDDGYTVEIPWEEVAHWCDQTGVKHVPTLDKFIFTSWDDLMSRVERHYDGVDPIGKTHIREGVVVRIDNRPVFTAFKHKNFSFKCLEGIVKDNASAPDMEEVEELLA
ncbi:MAG: hypothetical protein KH231_07655 [Dialister sp.]|uniref:RNA ligase family protein n=1 Tax=Dialister sp. TaxID=1955814 RepID=UPI001E0FAE6B|nr:RNA ligase family protein [Dialister sp.]MBS6715323.1 hypothetical protein [Dialister sp.]